MFSYPKQAFELTVERGCFEMPWRYVTSPKYNIPVSNEIGQGLAEYFQSNNKFTPPCEYFYFF